MWLVERAALVQMASDGKLSEGFALGPGMKGRCTRIFADASEQAAGALQRLCAHLAVVVLCVQETGLQQPLVVLLARIVAQVRRHRVEPLIQGRVDLRNARQRAGTLTGALALTSATMN